MRAGTPILGQGGPGGASYEEERFFGQEVSGEMSTGDDKWFSSKKGYGFITMEDGQEVFVHYTSIDGNGFRSLEQGEEVQFEVAQGPKGLQAAKVLRR